MLLCPFEMADLYEVTTMKFLLPALIEGHRADLRGFI